MKDLKIVFMGTPKFSVPVLEGLIENCNVIGVVTQPDKIVGRKKEIEFSPVKEVALQNSIPVFQPVKIREDYQSIIDINPDIIITCAYGQIIPKELLFFSKYKAINVHASLLPKYRGGAPIHWSIINGDSKTGITIMYMDVGMDDGDIIFQQEIPINYEDNLGVIEEKLSLLGKELLLTSLPKIITKDAPRIKQNEAEVTFAKIIKRENEFVDFNNKALDIYNKIRGLNPVPGASTFLNNKIVKIYDSKITEKESKEVGKILDITKEGILVGTLDYDILINEVKFEGKKRMLVKELINGIKKEEYIGKYFNEEG